MAELLRCFDYHGREVVLTEEQWIDHILVVRPDFKGLKPCIERAVSDPYRVMRDATFPNRECFYRHRTLPGPLSHLYLKVVVSYRATGVSGILVGTVITAYPTYRLKSSENQQLWP